MEQNRRKAELPPIPAKRYFTIGEVSELCGVKPHVLRLPRRARELLYEEGFTISGARNRLDHSIASEERPEASARAGRAGAPDSGGDVAAVKRELRAVLEQLQG